MSVYTPERGISLKGSLGKTSVKASLSSRQRKVPRGPFGSMPKGGGAVYVGNTSAKAAKGSYGRAFK